MVDAADKQEPLWKGDHQDKGVLRKFFGVIILIIIVIASMIAVYLITLPPETVYIYSDLKVDGIQVRRLNDEYVDENTTETDLDVVVYLTNDGELDSGNIAIDAYIRSFDTQNIETSSDKNDSVNMGPILTSETGKTNLNFTDLLIKEDEKYIIDFYIWEDNKVVEKASTTVKVPYVEVEKDPDVTSTDADDGHPGRSKEEKEDNELMPGFEVIPLLLALLAILAVYRKRRTNKN